LYFSGLSLRKTSVSTDDDDDDDDDDDGTWYPSQACKLLKLKNIILIHLMKRVL
jgi:hypothetical protein